ncbi:MAG: hypothetical protein HN855_02775 [Anaerolineae bacterium]|jgi:pimeloyl-ACP methyl ester carboxylesterase|nr:hypothetical protein [Anaerolineae bacterium]MBT7071095.1 hypothetical protein [Anaerolineae bacterium]MBT7324061.1 hypothetical protein [Anaerolineae bacterium]
MLKKFFLLALLMALLTACTPTPEENSALPNSPMVESPVTQKKCGDDVCDGPENTANCPQDCQISSASQPANTEEAGFWIMNPSSGAALYTRILEPANSNTSSLPALILIPGGTGTIDANKAQRIADEGFIVIFFDPDGRGQSEGEEDYNGTIQQDGLAAVIREVAALPQVDEARFGVASFSYGVTMATGTLARYPDLPVRFYIDWEGPVNRIYTTTGCTANNPRIEWRSCDDDEWWAEREALNFIGDLQVPYQRLQSERDHVQTTNDHAIEIINAAVAGTAPWVRLNDYSPNQSYDINNQPNMYAENSGESTEALFARHALEILAMLE